MSMNFCGAPITKQELDNIHYVVKKYPELARTEMASTICELNHWLRESGRPKTIECRQFLEKLEQSQLLILPAKKNSGTGKKIITHTPYSDPQPPISNTLKDNQPITLERVQKGEPYRNWREWVDRYHYLGFKTPFGASLRYFIYGSDQLLGCLQFSSPARRMANRDRWIGWTDTTRKHNLQLIINNSRFLIFPWVSIKNLASHVLSIASSQVKTDWLHLFNRTPLLIETLVDSNRYSGNCYIAANWISLGSTSGRGRDDTKHERHNLALKTIFVYPLVKNVQSRLTSLDNSHQNEKKRRHQ